MKTLQVFFATLFFSFFQSNAQVAVNVNGTPPAWAPASREKVAYYYLPEAETYYDVNASRFIYFGNGKWVKSKNLPAAYRNYDLKNGRTVSLIDYHGHSPYSHFKDHKVKYPKGQYKKQHKKLRSKPQHHDKHEDHEHGKGKGHGKGHKD